MKLPKWMQPKEILTLKYWIHIAIISIIVLGILKYIFSHDMLTFDMFWKVGVALIVADIIAHSLLKLK